MSCQRLPAEPEKCKNLRIIIFLLVCGKIVLYDFRGEATLQRILLFFAAGAIVLIISGIYIMLEKKMREKMISQSMGGGE